MKPARMMNVELFQKHRHIIWSTLGCVCPAIEEVNDERWVKPFIDKIDALYNLVFPNYPLCEPDKKIIIFLFRLLSHCLTTDHLRLSVRLNADDIFIRCINLIISYNNGEITTIQAGKASQKLLNTFNSLSKTNGFSYRTSNSSALKKLSCTRKQLRINKNNITTTQMLSQNSNRTEPPSLTLCKQTAVNMLVLYKGIQDVSPWYLLALITNKLDFCTDNYLSTTDFLYTLEVFNNYLWNKIHRKLLVLNAPSCKCHIKCLGFNRKQFSTLFNHCILDTTNVITLCEICRLTPNVCNTAAQKPRKSLVHQNIHLPRCTIDNLPLLKKEKLYHFQLNLNGDYKYWHIFHTNNSKNITNYLLDESCNGPKFRISGMCFGESRRCFNRVIRSFDQSCFDGLPKSNMYEIFQCDVCKRGNYNIDTNTCIEYIFNYIKRYSSQELSINLIQQLIKCMCDGCCVSITCYHRLLRLSHTRLSPTQLTQLLFITSLQNVYN